MTSSINDAISRACNALHDPSSSSEMVGDLVVGLNSMLPVEDQDIELESLKKLAIAAFSAPKSSKVLALSAHTFIAKYAALSNKKAEAKEAFKAGYLEALDKNRMALIQGIKQMQDFPDALDEKGHTALHLTALKISEYIESYTMEQDPAAKKTYEKIINDLQGHYNHILSKSNNATFYKVVDHAQKTAQEYLPSNVKMDGSQIGKIVLAPKNS